MPDVFPNPSGSSRARRQHRCRPTHQERLQEVELGSIPLLCFETLPKQISFSFADSLSQMQRRPLPSTPFARRSQLLLAVVIDQINLPTGISCKHTVSF
jgi:hypothetical protein